MLNRYNFASSSFEFSTFLSSRNAKKIACSPHFHLLHLISGVILQDYINDNYNDFLIYTDNDGMLLTKELYFCFLAYTGNLFSNAY